MSSQELTAVVMVRAASGKRLGAGEPITSQNLREYLPSAETLQTALAAFQRAGFQTGTRVANTFSITAAKETFEAFFGEKIDPKQMGNGELRVPPQLEPVLEAVTFEAPRELH